MAKKHSAREICCCKILWEGVEMLISRTVASTWFIKRAGEKISPYGGVQESLHRKFVRFI